MMERPRRSWGPLLRALVLSAALVLLGGTVSAETIHNVRAGESLWLLANRYHTTIQAIRAANGLTGSTIYVGQQLRIPAGGSSVHVVRRGESLWLIAQRYGVPLSRLRQANNIWHNLIYPGQRLVIPGTAGTNQAPGTSGVRIQLTPEERSHLARMVSAEAQGQPFAGKVAVVAVILNRIDDPRFPNTVWDVINAPFQFEPMRNGWFEMTTVLPESYAAVDAAVGGWDPTHGAVFFFNPDKSDNAFMRSRPHATTIGDHRFMY